MKFGLNLTAAKEKDRETQEKDGEFKKLRAREIPPSLPFLSKMDHF